MLFLWVFYFKNICIYSFLLNKQTKKSTLIQQYLHGTFYAQEEKVCHTHSFPVKQISNEEQQKIPGQEYPKTLQKFQK